MVTTRAVDDFVIISAPLRRDAEERRWYSEGAAACLVLTARGQLLEPHPIFGPTSYRLLARHVRRVEANTYAFARGLRHERRVAAPPAARDWSGQTVIADPRVEIGIAGGREVHKLGRPRS